MKDIPDLLDGLRRAPRILAQFVETIPRQKLDARRGDGFWTIAEHVCHLAQVQPMLLQRFQRFVSEEHPVFVPFLPGNTDQAPEAQPPMSIASALDQYADYRSKQLQLLESIDRLTWQKSGTHPEYDSYSLYILTRHVLMHDHWHMYRMEELWLTKDAYLTSLG